MINKFAWPLQQLRRLALVIEARLWAGWHQIAAPPDHEGATERWSPAAEFAAAEPPDWDAAARAKAADDDFWAQWNADMNMIETYVHDQLHTIEVLTRAFLTGGHTQDNLPIIVALAAP